ncbi:MAG TPA: molybdopterin-dependent oxidoreductase [Gaiellaceae bacterium]|nr:molybdopterin-dependent oxidoreductase [Gaiellaceae bacterium]
MDEPKRYGRGLFLATVAGGLSSLVWGKTVWSGLSSAVPSVPFVPSGWRIYTVAATMPVFDPATWRLEVGGLVEQPLTLDHRALLALPRTEEVRDFHCVTGWSVPNVRWAGVRLADLLDRVRPAASAHAVRFTSAEIPYVDYLTLDQARRSDVLLAYELDGAPLPRPHGAPLRLVMPEMYGYKSVKWVARVDLVRQPEDGYWELRGYDRDAWIQ